TGPWLPAFPRRSAPQFRPGGPVTTTLSAPPRVAGTTSRADKTPTSPLRPKRSPLLTGLMVLYLIYTLVPLVWLLLSATKTQNDLLSTPGLWFGKSFAFFTNIKDTLTYNDGIFL